MVTDPVSLRHSPLGRSAMRSEILADDEERGLYASALEHIEHHRRGLRVGTIVERQSNRS
jgi:hypothetical protein